MHSSGVNTINTSLFAYTPSDNYAGSALGIFPMRPFTLDMSWVTISYAVICD